MSCWIIVHVVVPRTHPIGGMSLTLARTQTHKGVSLTGTRSAAMCGGHWDLQETTYMSNCSQRDKPWTGFAFFCLLTSLLPHGGTRETGCTELWKPGCRQCIGLKTQVLPSLKDLAAENQLLAAQHCELSVQSPSCCPFPPGKK